MLGGAAVWALLTGLHDIPQQTQAGDPLHALAHLAPVHHHSLALQPLLLLATQVLLGGTLATVGANLLHARVQPGDRVAAVAIGLPLCRGCRHNDTPGGGGGASDCCRLC